VPRTLALTGASGFIGGHLAEAAVAAGWRVRALVRRQPIQPEMAALPVEFVPGALDDPSSLGNLVRGATAVAHVAGLVKARSRGEFFRVNEGGVANLIDAACAEGAAPRFLLISSLAAREPGLSDYAASKRAGEAILAERGHALPWTVLRPPVVYGPRDRQTLVFFRAVARGIGPLLAPEAARVSCLHVSDLSNAVVALLDAGAETYGRTYEIDDEQLGGYSWRGMIDVAAAHLGTRPRLVRVPAPVLGAAARIGQLVGSATGSAPFLSPGKVREMHHLDWVCRDTKFPEHVSWRARMALNAGFADAIAWYRSVRLL
jgi:nucleoside-diphosphate-sugar epimerase